ncbi:MAG TPA: MBL fold metallo-hydrolase [Desulfobacteraceae bacterium]|nr:MBL fold metallo-hydrolase [Deltaproteobacteria bacterium]HDI59369.1 MBL fold metallo-hydrolase [Desulfobacteraceae bacterium]
MQEIDFGPIRFIPGPNRGKYPHCHSLFIPGDGILIDPGADRRRLQRLREENQVREIWLSHWHEDHWMHLDLFDDLPLRLHPADAPPLASLDAFLDAYGISNPALRRDFARTLETRFHFRRRLPRADLGDGLTLSLDSVTVDVIHTPGHTPGHLCFFFRQPAVLFLGDYDLTPFGPWYGDRDSSIPETIASIERLRQIAARTWLTSHETGVFTAPPDDLWDDYLAVIGQREAKLGRFLTAPRRLEEIIDQWIVYRKAREPLDFFRFAEAAIIRKHLERMGQVGIVRAEKDRFYIMA